ncbi:hypothetical protein F5Y15DRAFT_159492 [Xylariaceae sp. FL0016]|nr:hypothetical protein F5Y15DRAFT_159492 [Xylariaceae sp. FL0016]
MSGSGGYYKYRCKYFYTNQCQNWVYVNHSACANCASEGRENPGPAEAPIAIPQQPQNFSYTQDVCVPRTEDGVMYYDLMEMVVTVQDGQMTSTLQYKSDAQAQSVATTNATPGTAIPTTAPSQR